MATSKRVNRVAGSPAVQVTGRGTDVAFVIDSKAHFDEVAEDLRAHLSANSGMFSKGNITVDAGTRLLSREELDGIKRIIEAHSGLTVTRFWCSADALAENVYNWESKPAPVHNDPALRRQAPTPEVAPPARPLAQPARNAGEQTARNRSRNRSHALLIRATFRSGESVHHDGDVVVLADVNPGAEIQADGDIVVVGSLKGLAHAGASGDARAVIIALEIASPRIKIGEYEAEAGPANSPTAIAAATGPKIAYVRRRSIHVAPFVGRFARYNTRGVPYDG